MKILVVAHNFTSGGAATACRRLIGAFRSQGMQVDLLSIKRVENLDSKYLRMRQVYCVLLSKLDFYLCKFIEPGSIHWQSSGLLGLLKARNINRFNPSVVNFHWIGHATISMRQLKRIDLPIIITMHDDWWLNAINHYDSINNQRESPLKKKIIRHLVNEKKSFLNKPNVKIVCPSREMKLKVSMFLPNKKSNVFVIPNPVSSRVFYPLEKDKSNKVLLYAGGTQDPRKGYDLLLNTVNSMQEKCEILVLGKEGAEVAGVNQQIIITGHKWINSESEMNVIYNQSSMTMVPSRQEAFGQVASESLMTGTPVTCFEVGGLKDIVKTELNGFLIENFDTTRMAEHLDTFLRNDNFDRKVISADATLRFSEEAVAMSYLAIL